MAEFRKKIVKRAAISTAEVLNGPVRRRNKKHLLIGYVHNEYPPIYTMLARHSGFNSTFLMRGTEGCVTPSLRKRSEFVRYWEQSEDVVVEADPSKIGIEQGNRPVPIPHALMPIIDREFGLCAVGKNMSEIGIISDIYEHTMESILRAEKLGGFKLSRHLISLILNTGI